jgi:hypothetical protein
MVTLPPLTCSASWPAADYETAQCLVIAHTYFVFSRLFFCLPLDPAGHPPDIGCPRLEWLADSRYFQPGRLGLDSGSLLGCEWSLGFFGLVWSTFGSSASV